MRTCEFCGTDVSTTGGFCGFCGQGTNKSESAEKTHTPRALRRVTLQDEQTERIVEEITAAINKDDIERDMAQVNTAVIEIVNLTEDKKTGTDFDMAQVNTAVIEIVNPLKDKKTGIDYNTNQIHDESEEDKEQRRRLALVDFSLPPLTDAETELPTAQVPTVQGTPQVNGAPTVVGTPVGADNMTPHEWSMPTPPLVLSRSPITARPPGVYGPRLTSRPGPHLTNKPQPQKAPGCSTWLIIVIIPIIILSSIIGIGLTILSPSLTLEGKAQVVAGELLHLHGDHFVPGNAVTCTLDGTTTLYGSIVQPVQRASAVGPVMLANSVGQIAQKQAGTTTSVSADGTFNTTFTVEQNWNAGPHTIRATEALSPRSASIAFSVAGSTTATSVVTVTNKPIASATAIPSVAPSPIVGTGLSAISPSTITFGPISVGYTQAVTTQVTLSSQGTGQLAWNANWDQAQASWLQLNSRTGQIQAPNTQIITIGAVAGQLNAGTYNATITFSSNAQIAQSVTLNVTLTVQAGCINTTPPALNFIGTIGANDPGAQTITLNNCGVLGNWSATTSGGSWLIVSPTSGNLNNGANQSIVVSTTLANIKSGAGTYQGQVQFTNGTAHATVTVTLIVQNQQVGSTLGINTNTIITRDCSFVRGTWVCNVVTLNSNQDATSNLDWNSSSSGIAGITVKPANGTLQPGQTVPIEIDIPRFPCNTGTVIFKGPTNSVSVTIGC